MIFSFRTFKNNNEHRSPCAVLRRKMNMYANKLAVCIKTAGQVLRDQNNTVKLPFGSEYSIFIKNLNTVRALVKVTLDGVDVTDGNDLVIQPNNSLDLERFMKAGNLDSGNKFKFIERTSKVEAHRGVGAEDGLLRVEFTFEKIVPIIDWNKIREKMEKEVHIHHHHDYYPYRTWLRYGDQPYAYPLIGSFVSNTDQVFGSAVASNVSINNAADDGGNRSLLRSGSATSNYSANVAQTYDAGITVPGSISEQKFTVVTSFPCEDEKHVIVLKLLGETSGKPVEKAVTVKFKQTCGTCGTRNRGKIASFCRECGTSLNIC